MNTQMQNDLERRLKDKDFAEEYGENIARAEIAVTVSQARRSCKLTQEELAKILGYSQSYIAKLEGGDANPTIGNVGKILANMGLRLVAGIGVLSSRIEEKGIWNYSANANDVTMNWFGEVADGVAVSGQCWVSPSWIRLVSGKGVYTYCGAVVSDPDVSGVSGYGESFDTIWEDSKKDDSDILIIEGAKK